MDTRLLTYFRHDWASTGNALMAWRPSGQWVSYAIPTGDPIFDDDIPNAPDPMPIGLFLVDDGAYARVMVTMDEGYNFYAEAGANYVWQPIPFAFDADQRLKHLWSANGVLVGVSSTYKCYVVDDLWHGQMTLLGAAPISTTTDHWPDFWMSETGRLHATWRDLEWNLLYDYSDDYGATWHAEPFTLASADSMGMEAGEESMKGTSLVGRPAINGVGDTVHVFSSDEVGRDYWEDIDATHKVRHRTWRWTANHYYSTDGGATWEEHILTGDTGTEVNYTVLYSGFWIEQVELRERSGTCLSESIPGAWMTCPLCDTGLYMTFCMCNKGNSNADYIYRWQFDEPETDPREADLLSLRPADELGWIRDYCKRWHGSAARALVAHGSAAGSAADVYDIANDTRYEVFWQGDFHQFLPQTVNVEQTGLAFWW
jgi:hypothetical protein